MIWPFTYASALVQGSSGRSYYSNGTCLVITFMRKPLPTILAAILIFVSRSPASTLYVSLQSTNPVPPYADWSSAATKIQDAIDSAQAGDDVLVTNGVYVTGGRAVNGTLTNRVAILKPITVRSVNGPEVTVIQGDQAPGTTNGASAIRCLYLTNGAYVSGFTLTNGATRNSGPLADMNGGGAWCGASSVVLSNCILRGNAAASDGGGVWGGTLRSCALIGNSAKYGGGAASNILESCNLVGNTASFYGGGTEGASATNCTLSANSAGRGGGAYTSILFDCTLNTNMASFGLGGGAHYCRLTRCAVLGNQAQTGGGVDSGYLTNCIVIGNLAGTAGGCSSTFFRSALVNSLLAGNQATNTGAALDCALTSCTVTANLAKSIGGLAYSFAYNCIIYYNQALSEANYTTEYSTLNYCCTFPLPMNGTGNIDTPPALASMSHISSTSPCRGAGNSSYASGVDIDSETWATPPSIGCDEPGVATAGGPLTVDIRAPYSTISVGFELRACFKNATFLL